MDPLLRFISSVCVQVAVYWGDPSPDGFGGFNYATVKEIYCRWDDVSKRITNNNGEEVVSQAEVLVLEDLDENGLLFLGTLDDLDSAEEDNPGTVSNAYKIQKIEKNPLFKSTSAFVRVVYL